MIIYGRPLGAKWNTAAVFVWIFHLGVKDALTMLNFCRSSGRVCAWNLPEYKQQNSDKHKCFFLQLITVVFALHV